jgi:hypothetical protein
MHSALTRKRADPADSIPSGLGLPVSDSPAKQTTGGRKLVQWIE